MASANIAGLRELRQTLIGLGAEIASTNGGPVRSALQKGTKKVRDIARGIAKQGANTGRLANAIVSQRDKDPAGQGLTESYIIRVKNGNSREDVRGAFYWLFVEFGTVKQPAQPFLRPAFDVGKQGFLDNFTTDLTKAIETAVRRRAARRG
jgi:HK97 gp10 family phage protein